MMAKMLGYVAVCLLISLTQAQRRRNQEDCTLTIQVDANQIQGICNSGQPPQGLMGQEIQAIKQENANLKADLESMREEYKSMVDSVKQLNEETATWREIVEWPITDVVFGPDNSTLYISPDGPTYRDCTEAVATKRKQGIYSIKPDNAMRPFQTYCDEDGWTVIQRRFDGSVEFYLDWDKYMGGFGRLGGEFWLGLENMYLLTQQDSYALRVEALGYNGKLYYSENPGFKIGDEESEFTLHIGNKTDGNSKDMMVELNGLAFTTHDVDNDLWWDNNCASQYHGAFWLQDCGFDLNREFCDGRGCMSWGERPIHKSLMKMKPGGGSRGTAPAAPPNSRPTRKPKKQKKPKSGKRG